MKKYILLLLLFIFPTIVLADCAADIASSISNIPAKYNEVVTPQGSINCGTVTVISDQPNDPCKSSFNTFEATLRVAMRTYNSCSTTPEAENLYNTIHEYLNKFNNLPAKPNFDFNNDGMYDCSAQLQSTLKNVKTNYDSLMHGCYNSGDKSNCAVAIDSFKKSIDRTKLDISSYTMDNCDLVQYKKDVMVYVDDFNSKFPESAYDYNSGYDTCTNQATELMQKMEDAKKKIVDGNCKFDEEISTECKAYINDYKLLLNEGDKKSKGDLSSCATLTNFRKRLQEHIGFYDTIAYVRKNDLTYENLVERQQKEIVKDPVFCPLGADVTQDLVGVLRILKIAAPLLVLVTTVYEVIKSVASGEIQSKSKELFKKFGKRCLGALLLFVIPVLIDTFMQLLNVWDDTGRCVLTETQTEYTERTTSSSTTKTN